MTFFRGAKRIGNLSREMQSNMRRMSRTVREASYRASRIQAQDAAAQIEQGSKRMSGGIMNFGLDADRPTSDYMFDRGINSMLYFATDTSIISAWNGTAWVTTTLS